MKLKSRVRIYASNYVDSEDHFDNNCRDILAYGCATYVMKVLKECLKNPQFLPVLAELR
jgi:hypothetical protein